jgi:hypothetical protein
MGQGKLFMPFRSTLRLTPPDKFGLSRNKGLTKEHAPSCCGFFKKQTESPATSSSIHWEFIGNSLPYALVGAVSKDEGSTERRDVHAPP